VIRAWIEVPPDEGGCRSSCVIGKAAACRRNRPIIINRRRGEIDRALAELTARLDERQGVMAVQCDGGDLGKQRRGCAPGWAAHGPIS
jgi:hypothetical protein